MPARGWSKYTPEQLETLFEAYKRMPLREAAVLAGLTYNAAFFQLQSRGLTKKPFSASITLHPVTISESDVCYFAGLIDGEGTVTIRKVNRGTDRNFSYRPCLIVANTDKRLIDWLMETFPSPRRFDSRITPQQSTAYRFWLEGLGYLPLFEALQPKLVIKGDILELVIEWTRERLSQSRTDPLTTRQLEIISLIRARNTKPSRRLPVAM